METTLRGRVSRGRYVVFMVGVWLAALVGAFENTGLGPSYPDILAHFGNAGDISLFSTIFMVGCFLSAMLASRYISRRTVAQIFVAFTLVQVAGLVICRLASSLALFLFGRFVQGVGEGIIVASVFYCLSAFLPKGRMRKMGYASVSVAWLIASLSSPSLYAVLSAPEWKAILSILIGVSILSCVCLVLGRVPVAPREDEAQGKSKVSVGSVVQVILVAVVLFAYSQFANLLHSPGLASVVGILVLSILLYGSFNSRSVLRIDSSIRGLLFVRAVVSGLYASGMAFVSLLMIWAFGASTTAIALAMSVAAIGWTTGSVFQANLRATSRRQLSLGLAALGGGLALVLVGVLAKEMVPLFLGAFTSGLGIGVATNALPVFVTDSVADNDLAESLTGLEVADTVTTTVALTVLGVLITQALASPETALWVGVIYGALVACAFVSSLMIARMTFRH